MTITELPTEIIYMILEFLPSEDRLSVRALNRKFKNIMPLSEFLRGEDMQDVLLAICKKGLVDRLVFFHREGLFEKVDIRKKDQYNQTALTIACSMGHLEVVRYFKDKFGLEKEDFREEKPLLGACRGGHLELVRYLKEEFSLGKSDAQGEGEKNWPLAYACREGHLEVVRCLREEFYLENIDAQSLVNLPLQWACMGGHLDVIRYLREGFGLCEEDVQSGGDAALRQAVMRRHRKGYREIILYVMEEFNLRFDGIENIFPI